MLAAGPGNEMVSCGDHGYRGEFEVNLPGGPSALALLKAQDRTMFAKHAPGSLDRGGKIAKTSVWGGSSRGGREGSGSSEFSEEYMQSAPSFPPKIRSFWGFPTDRSGTSWDMKLESSAEQSETQNMNCSKQ